MLIRRCIRIAISALTLCACARTIERAFERQGHVYPLHIDRHIGQPNLGYYGGRCRFAPELRPVLEAAVSQLQTARFAEIVARFCPNAEASVFTSPFMIRESESQPTANLAFHMSCFSSEVPEAFVGQSDDEINLRHASELDSWLARRHGNVWTTANVAVFEINQSDVSFSRMMERYEPTDDSDRAHGAMFDWYDPIEQLACCGTLAKGEDRCRRSTARGFSPTAPLR